MRISDIFLMKFKLNQIFNLQNMEWHHTAYPTIGIGDWEGGGINPGKFAIIRALNSSI